MKVRVRDHIRVVSRVRVGIPANQYMVGRVSSVHALFADADRNCPWRHLHSATVRTTAGVSRGIDVLQIKGLLTSANLLPFPDTYKEGVGMMCEKNPNPQPRQARVILTGFPQRELR